MYGLFKSEVENTTMLVMDLVSLGSLEKFLDEQAGALDLKELQWFCVHIARGMAYLHSRNILHNDLAARNVLLTINDKQNEGKYLPKISDFGLSFQKGATRLYTVRPGQIVPSTTAFLIKLPKARWSAPEVLTKYKFSASSDVWSFGVLMWEIFSEGMMPFWKIKDEEKLLTFIVEQDGRLSKPEKCPEEVWKVATSCWDKQPRNRPSMDDLETLLNKMVNPSPSVMN